MADYTQETRLIRLDTALGGDTLMVARFSGAEGMSMAFQFDLDLVSTEADIDPDQLLRTPAVIRVTLADESERVIHGRISRFSLVGRKEDLLLYRAQVVPWTWFLSLRRNSRMFQQMSVVDIATKLFQEHGYSDFEVRCDSRPPREYVIQYNEPDLSFIGRWLETEGIFYYFEHTEDRHLLVLAERNSALQPCPVYDTVQVTTEPLINEDTVLAVSREQSIQVGKITLRDYDYLQPSLTLESTLEGEGIEEVFEYPGNFTTPEDGERYARYRLEAEEARREQVSGAGNCRWMVSGHTFTLEGHFDPAINGEYLITAVSHSCKAGGFRAGEQGDLDYRNEFTAIPLDVPYRPLRVTPRPTVKGSQTAIVVGPAGEEVYVDKYGRVKVQFHWDREGKRDENSSCWVRFASPWGGKGYGSVQFPRIGTEVLVDFLEGDPDRPIITACVYNAEQMPPFDLPDSGIQMGMKSRSSPGGGGHNEITMTDTKGKEAITIHGQHDMNTTVGNDQTLDVGNNRTSSVAVDETMSVGSNQALSVGADQTIDVGGNQTENVGGDCTVSIGGAESHSVGGDQSVTIGGNRSVSAGGNDEVFAGGNMTHGAAANLELSAGAAFKLIGGATGEVSAGATLDVSAGATIKLSAGGSTIEIGPAGVTITTGGLITLQGSTIKLN